MSFEETPPVDVDESTFYEVLVKLRDVRKWAVINKGDPWAFRQAMITVMAIDTACALDIGIEPAELVIFDMHARDNAQEFIESIPEVNKLGR